MRTTAPANLDTVIQMLSSLGPQASPNWTTRYRIGVELNRVMEHEATLEQVADELGITKQNAYTETVLALGTFACRLHQRFR